ncbi:hypothetical protein BDV19DRAFT_328978 [Aspergillus venezuelensis]
MGLRLGIISRRLRLFHHQKDSGAKFHPTALTRGANHHDDACPHECRQWSPNATLRCWQPARQCSYAPSQGHRAILLPGRHSSLITEELTANLRFPSPSRVQSIVPPDQAAQCSGCLYGLLLCWLQCQRPSLPSTASDLRHLFDKYDPTSRLTGGASSLALFSCERPIQTKTSRVAVHS